MAPRGQMVLQEKRDMKIDSMIIAINTLTLWTNNHPTALLSSGFIRTRGMPASNVPAYQKYLQNHVWP